jgi:hypothetical protein
MTLRPTTAIGFCGDAIADSEIIKRFFCLVLPDGDRIWRFPRHDAVQDTLHTATCARRLVVLVGTLKALAIAVRNMDARQRVTLLRQRLHGTRWRHCAAGGEFPLKGVRSDITMKTPQRRAAEPGSGDGLARSPPWPLLSTRQERHALASGVDFLWHCRDNDPQWIG